MMTGKKNGQYKRSKTEESWKAAGEWGGRRVVEKRETKEIKKNRKKLISVTLSHKYCREVAVLPTWNIFLLSCASWIRRRRLNINYLPLFLFFFPSSWSLLLSSSPSLLSCSSSLLSLALSLILLISSLPLLSLSPTLPSLSSPVLTLSTSLVYSSSLFWCHPSGLSVRGPNEWTNMDSGFEVEEFTYLLLLIYIKRKTCKASEKWIDLLEV